MSLKKKQSVSNTLKSQVVQCSVKIDLVSFNQCRRDFQGFTYRLWTFSSAVTKGGVPIKRNCDRSC